VDAGHEVAQRGPIEDLVGCVLRLRTAPARPGTQYKFQLGQQGLQVPNPASRSQPLDVHGPSEVVNHNSYVWKDERWRGRRWEEAVIYEIHIGAFTQQGTFLRLLTA
jgi:maltooligosyltrehalose trehalohydrolase